jgi:predicted nucleotidyltransferase component of viral defense system
LEAKASGFYALEEQMIERREIDQVGEDLGVNTSDVQRDYIFSWLLRGIFAESELGKILVLKGGNCLRKGYFPNGRFSGDLDFSCPRDVPTDRFTAELNRICQFVHHTAGVEFDTSRTFSRPKRGADDDLQIVEARVYFRDFYGEESSIIISVRMDVTEWDRLYLPVQTRRLIHAYSDQQSCQAYIRCVKLEEQLASKMKCLLQRRHVADLFDLVYSSVIHPEIALNRAEVVSTFLRKTIFSGNPGFAKGLFIDLPLAVFKGFWSKYIVCPVRSMLDFGAASTAFEKLINDLFENVSINQRRGQFFPSSLRNPIMEAAHNLTLLDIVYDGKRRMVEPYSLLYKRRQDGVAREYLYVYDRTGGSSPPGIKCLVADKMESIKNTTEAFEPRQPVELKKAGEVLGSVEFEARRGSGYSRSRSSEYIYRVECSVCGKQFRRKNAYDTRLNSHEDSYGNRCIGRIGYMV